MYQKTFNTWFTRLFPTTVSFIIFTGYIAFSTSLGILVTNSQVNEKYSYNVTTVVFLVEVTKFLTALIFYLNRKTYETLRQDISKYKRVLGLYMIPGALYCLYNNLTFVNLSSFDPTTYFLLMQLRVLVTGVIYQVVFRRQLSRLQWFALVVLTVGCLVKQLDVPHRQTAVHNPVLGKTSSAPGLHAYVLSSYQHELLYKLFLVFAQILCSCVAGVCNERLLKGHSGQASLALQNIFMYFDSSLCNLAVIFLTGELGSAFSLNQLEKIVLSPRVVIIIVNNTALGLITSAFLKDLNSILKVFASAIEPVLLAFLCYIIFGYHVTIYTVLSIILVIGALLLYAHNPIVTTSTVKNDLDETEKALEKATALTKTTA